ncbi:MAG TPA: hypothetical protein VFM46_01860 [Pseudomonadales bacterium]|nr:hypothetical protein [Pseudomonadales bacterium]
MLVKKNWLRALLLTPILGWAAESQIQQIIPLVDIPAGSAKSIDTDKASIWIWHRNAQQIEDLERRLQGKQINAALTGVEPKNVTDTLFRSWNKEWGVYIFWRDNGEIMLRQHQNFYPCQKLEYFADKHQIKGGVEWLGGIYCSKIEGKFIALKDSIFVYDLAGNPRFGWVDPLTVPDYRVGNGQIELGKSSK